MSEKGRKKTGGRVAGVPNKTVSAAAVREALAEKGVDLVEMLTEILPTLDEGKRADVCLRLLEYVSPKLRSVENHEIKDMSAEPSQEELDQFNKLVEQEVERRLRRAV